MRVIYSIFSVFAFTGLVACGNSQSTKTVESDTIIEDSIPPIIEPSPSFAEDEGKVIADLNFFISEKDFDKNKDKYLADIRGSYDYEIGTYICSHVDGQFENDSLYYVTFIGQPYEADDYTRETIRQYQDLVKLYKSKYGNPSYEVSDFPECYELSEGESYYLADWDLGNRKIQISLKDRSPYYSLNLSIYREDIARRIRDRYEKEHNANKKDAKSVI